MGNSRFAKAQITSILKAQAAGMATAMYCRLHGKSTAVFYSWKEKF